MTNPTDPADDSQNTPDPSTPDSSTPESAESVSSESDSADATGGDVAENQNVENKDAAKQTQQAKANSEYGASDLEHLSDLEHVRERPSMYIGDRSVRGFHHLVYEVVDNSIDEAMAEFASAVSVIIHADNSVTVEDDGRGIPV
ncbi:MAG: ATP-binding protein, partial [Pirellulaceae bacterium]